MEIAVSSRHGHLKRDEEEYIRKKLPKLPHIFERVTSIEVTVDLAGPVAQVELVVAAEHKKDFVATERHESGVPAAFDLAMGKMERQLRRYKEKITHHPRSNPELPVETSARPEVEGETDEGASSDAEP